MFKNNSKRKRLSDLLIPGIIFAVIGAVFAFQGIRDYNNLNGDLLNLNTASVSDLADGKYVEINVEYANYSFCENVETTNYVFKRTTEQYYLINALENNDYYLGLNVAESKKDDLEKLSDYTWYHSDTNPGPLHYTGKLCKSNNEIMGYMRDFVYDMYASSYDITLTSEDKTLLDSYMQPYYIKVMTKEGCRTSIIIGLVFFVIGILLAVFAFIRHKNMVYTPEIPSAPYPDAYGDPNTPNMNTGINYTDSGVQNPGMNYTGSVAQNPGMNDTYSPYNGTMQYGDQAYANTNPETSEPTTPFSNTDGTNTDTASGLDHNTFNGNGNSSFKLKD